MTAQEFSNEFDILYNNIMSNQAPGLDEYEKSVFLTQAQEDIIKAFYQGTSAGLGPFENTELVRRALDGLLITDYPTYDSASSLIHKNTSLWKLPDDVWFIVYEAFTKQIQEKDIITGKFNSREFNIRVVPVTYDDYIKTINNPFKGVSDNRILRLDYAKDTVMLVSNNEFNTLSVQNKPYIITYVKRPYPIILTDLGSSGLTINDKTTPKDIKDPCELSSSIHRLILTQAVALAAAAYKS